MLGELRVLPVNMVDQLAPRTGGTRDQDGTGTVVCVGYLFQIVQFDAHPSGSARVGLVVQMLRPPSSSNDKDDRFFHIEANDFCNLVINSHQVVEMLIHDDPFDTDGDKSNITVIIGAARGVGYWELP
jgi:hypothetical protein